jgi:hypothetical protein
MLSVEGRLRSLSEPGGVARVAGLYDLGTGSQLDDDDGDVELMMSVVMIMILMIMMKKCR